MYKYVLNYVVTISIMFPKYFEYYYTISLRGPFLFVDTLYMRPIARTLVMRRGGELPWRVGRLGLHVIVYWIYNVETRMNKVKCQTTVVKFLVSSCLSTDVRYAFMYLTAYCIGTNGLWVNPA